MSQPAVPRTGALPTAWGIALLLSMLLSWASWPGFMSFDSLEALRQARTSVEGNQYPPFGSYVWRVLDWIWPGPTLMQLVQNTLLFGSFGSILALLRWPPLLLAATLSGTLLLPPVLGTMLVVWKDVAVAACFMAGFACLFAIRLQAVRRPAVLLFGGVLITFCGMAYRFNAASGAWPLLLYAAWLAFPSQPRLQRMFRSVVASIFVLFMLFALVWMVNSLRFPTFERLQRNTNMDSVMLYDLVGISAQSGESFVRDKDGQLVSVDYLRKIYDPRHLNITGMNDVEGLVASAGESIRYEWWRAVGSEPNAYLEHRLNVFREYIGLHRHEVFYVTHPTVDENIYGIKHEPTLLTANAIGHVWENRNSWCNRAWLYYTLAAVMLTALWLGSVVRLEACIVFFSGMLYLAPMFLITPAGDLRYNLWPIWASLATLAIAITALACSITTHPWRKKIK